MAGARLHPSSSSLSLSLSLAILLIANSAPAQTNFWWTNNTDRVWSAANTWTNNAANANVPGSGGSNDYSIIFQNTSAINTTGRRTA